MKKIGIIFVIIGIVVLAIIFFNKTSENKEKEPINFLCKENNTKIRVGDTKKIKYEINDDSLEVEWFSNNDVVTVTNGVIKANKYGQSVITGLVRDGENTITNACVITTYTGIIGVNVSKIKVDSGFLLMKKNSKYALPFIIAPLDAYVESIEYYSNDSNIATVEDNMIISKNEGTAIISMVVNNNITKDLIVKVSSKTKENKFVSNVNSVSFDDKKLTIDEGKSKVLNYTVKPKDGYIESIKWTSSNPNVATVSNGKVKAISEGDTTIKVIINSDIVASINVIVKGKEIKPTATPKPVNAKIVIDKSPAKTIQVGESTSIIAHVNPKNSPNKIKYISSNPKIATVDQNGIIKGIKSGKTTITVFNGTSNAKFFTITVQSTASIPQSNAKYVWGYSSPRDKTPVYAGVSFFQALASRGKGSLNGNTYTISSSGNFYSYDINNSTLTINGYIRIKVRVYYPPETDLSTANTLVYLGGDGEANFGGYFSTIAVDPSVVKSSGILILVAQGNGASFDGNSAIWSTRFVQIITDQKSGVRNSILGFSTGGKFVLEASHNFNYSKTIIFSSWSPDPASTVNVKGKEVLYFVPENDSLYRLAKETLVELKNYGYQNVTLVTNSSELLNMFNGSGFQIINPGTGMVPAHVSRNVAFSGVISYANE